MGNFSNVPIEDKTDHLGKVFKSISEMCRYWNIDVSSYNGRLKKGWSKEKALTTPINKSKKSIEDRTDHQGKVFDTVKLMCEYWGIDSALYGHRLAKGWSKEKALTTPNLKIEIPVEDRTDHQGKVFDTIEDMCKYWGVLYITYMQRLKKGWSKEKALQSKMVNVSSVEDRTDHLGKVFRSTKKCVSIGV